MQSEVPATLAEAPALRGPRAATPWDPALAVALPECGVRAEEETVLNDLLTDRGGRGILRVPTDTPSSRASLCTTSPGTGTPAFLATPKGDCAVSSSEAPAFAG
ncbi:DUF2399 domain-containing protein [Streptomyces flaveolus]